MKNLLLIFGLWFFYEQAYAVCSSPISRTNSGTNSVLTSTKYNLDINTVYNKVNSLPGDCVLDDSLSGTKLIDATVSAAKLASNSVTTAKIADGAVTAAKLAAAIDNLVPVGTILTYGGSTAPTGYLLGQGQSLSRTTYASLFAVFGTSFGTADGNSFNNVDCRGRFTRFVDGGQNRDPDRASRLAMNAGGAVGDNVGSVQSDQFGAHNHLGGDYFNTGSDSEYGRFTSYSGTKSGVSSTGTSIQWYQHYTNTAGGNETRPENFNANCIVKY